MKSKIFSGGVLAFFMIILLSSTTLAQVSTVCPMAIYEGQAIQLRSEAFDPDPEIGPAGTLLWGFSEPFGQDGFWQSKKGQHGIYNFWVTVSDGELSDTKYSCVEVLPNNRPPVLEPVPEFYVQAGQESDLQVECWDPDSDVVSIDFAFRGHPIAYVYYELPGSYPLRVTCSDGFGGVDSQMTTLHIMEQEPAETTRVSRPAPVLPQPVQSQPTTVEVTSYPAPVPQPIEYSPSQSTPQPLQVEIIESPKPKPTITEVEYIEPVKGVCPTGYIEEVIIRKQVVEPVPQPEATCPTGKVVEVIELPASAPAPQPKPSVDAACPQTVLEIVEMPAKPGEQSITQYEIIENVAPKAAEPKPQVIELPETVCRKDVPTVVDTSSSKTTRQIESDNGVKTYVIQYKIPKKETVPERIVRRVFKSSMERKLEISGFLYSEYDCKCDHPAVEYYQSLQEEPTEFTTDSEGSATYYI